MNISQMGIETERFSKSIFRLLKTCGISIRNTHIVIDKRILRIDPAGSVQGANSLLKRPASVWAIPRLKCKSA